MKRPSAVAARGVLASFAIVAISAGCTVTDSRTFKEIPAAEFPAGLRVTSPPTTTTTTTTTTVPGPTSTSTTTTTIPVARDVFQVFYVQGFDIRAVSLEEPRPVSPQRKLLALTRRIGMISPRLRLATVIGESALLLAPLERGVISIELGRTLQDVLPEDLPLFFAQVVLTVLAPSQQGQVVFTQEGNPYPAVKADQTVLEPGQPVAWEDYSSLIFGQEQPPVSPTTIPPITDPSPSSTLPTGVTTTTLR